MGTITLSFSNNYNKPNKEIEYKNRKKIQLTYHGPINPVPEYFSYINADGEEVKLTDKSYMITKISSTKHVGKKTYVSKIPLTYVPAQEEIKHQPEFFTYNDTEIYLDKPTYDEESNTYKGVLEVVDVYDKEIKLYEA